MGVNKNDLSTEEYTELEFQTIKQEFQKLIKNTGFTADNTPFIPMSGFCGENVITKSKKIKWYEGKTLFEQIEQTNRLAVDDAVVLRSTVDLHCKVFNKL